MRAWVIVVCLTVAVCSLLPVSASRLPPNPDPTCASTTASPTGHTPFSWTPCRQDTYDLMEAHYKKNPSAPATDGGTWYRWIRNRADGREYSGTSCPANSCYADGGQYAAFIVQAEGCAAKGAAVGRFADRAYARMNAWLNSREKLGYEASPYVLVRKLGDSNPVRERPLRILKTLDTIKPCITQAEYDRVKIGVAEQLQSALMGGYTHTVPLNDSDNIIGFYFAIAVAYLMDPTYQLAVDNFNNLNLINPKLGGKVGGLDATNTPEEYLSSTGSKTMRNAIRFYVEYLGEDGAWYEGPDYDKHTLELLIEGYDAVKTLTGNDHFPEITAWLPKHAAYLLHELTPNLTQCHQHGDIADERQCPRSFFSGVAMELAGVLKGTTAGRKLHALIVERGKQFGLTGVGSIEPNAANTNPFFLYDPYESPIAWRDTLSFSDKYVRLAFRKSHLTAPTASQFFADYGGGQRFSTRLNRAPSVHHAENYPLWGNWELYRNGEWAVTSVRDNVVRAFREGANTVLVHGRGRQGNVYTKFWEPAHHANFTYVVGTTGGEKLLGRAYCGMGNTPDIFLHENTRSQVYLPRTAGSDTDIVVTYDRINALTTVPEPKCYNDAENTHVATYDNFHHKLLINHTQTLPTPAGNAYTWKTPGGTPAKMTVVYPTTFNSAIVNEVTDVAELPAWRTVTKSERKWHIRNSPADTVQWNTFLTVHEVGTAGTVNAKTDPGKVEGVHIVRAGEADALVVFNSEPGANLNPTPAHQSHPRDLAVVRFRETGFSISWNAVASSTWILLNDLNPENQWTVAMDGGGARAISADANGQYYMTASGAGPHSIIVAGR